jgi:hypothetical protein
MEHQGNPTSVERPREDEEGRDKELRQDRTANPPMQRNAKSPLNQGVQWHHEARAKRCR